MAKTYTHGLHTLTLSDQEAESGIVFDHATEADVRQFLATYPNLEITGLEKTETGVRVKVAEKAA